MGYCMSQREAEFRIKAENKEKALKAIKDLKGQETVTIGAGPAHFSWVDTDEFMKAKTFGQAMAAWRWDVYKEDSGDITYIDFTGEKLGNDKLLFDTIAPFVEEGSYIEMNGEDGYLWRWCFYGGECEEKEGKVEWV